MSTGTPWKMAAIGICVLLIITVISTLLWYERPWNPDVHARRAFAKAEVKVVQHQYGQVQFDNLFVARHADGRYVLCGTATIPNKFGLDGYSAFYATGPLVVTQFDLPEEDFHRQVQRYCAEGAPPT